MPVSEETSAKNNYGVKNTASSEFNALLLEQAYVKGAYYVNTYEEFSGESGALEAGLSSDGIHLGKAGIQRQMQYLRTHTVDQY